MRSLSGSRITVKLVLSYVFDWVIIALIAVVGALFTLIPGNHRPFSLADPDISFPFTDPETISTVTLVLVSLLAPAVIVILISLILVPGPTVSKDTPRSLIWRRKLWEWNTGWMGLALSLASAFMITDGMKILFGRPRPDLLARCNADVSRMLDYKVGGYGTQVPQGQYLVSYGICRQPDQGILADGFMSFPSGHASFSWAGLIYLTLFLCAKFAITIPYLLPGAYSATAFPSHEQSKQDLSSKDAQPQRPISLPKILRSQAAAPPTYLLVLAFVPVAAAVYIGSTRFTDYRHHGIDLIAGSLIGFLTAYGSFRWYHAPIRQGAGWSWGPRSHEKAFAVGLGVQGYAGGEDTWWKKNDDIEQGNGEAPNSRSTPVGVAI